MCSTICSKRGTFCAIPGSTAPSTTRVAGGGGVQVSNINPSAHATGTVNMTVGTATDIEAGGTITLSANHGAAGQEISDGSIIDANYTNDGGDTPDERVILPSIRLINVGIAF